MSVQNLCVDRLFNKKNDKKYKKKSDHRSDVSYKYTIICLQSMLIQ